MRTPLDTAKGWWLEQIQADTAKDSLVFTLYEKQFLGNSLLHTPKSRRAQVIFFGVVTYLVSDEANLPWSQHDVSDEGYLHKYSKSRFLDFMNHGLGESEFKSAPLPSSHYGLATSDHIVYVMATQKPHVEIVC